MEKLKNKKKALFFLFPLILIFTSYVFFIKDKTDISDELPDKDSVKPINLIVFGDSGTGGKEQKQLANLMLQYQFDFIIHTGDIAYPDGSIEQLEKFFFEIYKEHLQKAKFFPTPGNHDYLTDNLGPYLEKFLVPRYYSFDLQNIHLISLDSNSITEDMLSWLEKDLSNSTAQWKIAFFHHPPYSSGEVHGSNYQTRKLIVPVLENHGVDLVFSGHEHNYERFCPLKDGICTSNGTVYIVSGGGSKNIYSLGNLLSESASHSAQTHFVYTIVNNCVIENKTINLSGKVIDKFALSKCP